MLINGYSEENLAALAEKEKLSVVVVDSGLGGLSIYAAIAEGLRCNGRFNEVLLTYFNAWPEQHRGYNNMADMDERIRVFDRALLGVAAYRPDLLLIACNTLSILFPRTAFSRSARIPVIGIVAFGVDIIHERMYTQSDSRTIIFGTLTTIAADVHRQTLVENGIDRRRLATQACDQLAGAIEFDPHGTKVRQMIATCVDQAAGRLEPGQGAVFAALCCTHYGYSATYFQQFLEQHPTIRAGPGAVAIINPNQAMADFVLTRFSGPTCATCAVNLRVVSKITWSDAKIRVMAETVKPVSAAVARALYDYDHNPELF